jgi:hypothetical protein
MKTEADTWDLRVWVSLCVANGTAVELARHSCKAPYVCCAYRLADQADGLQAYVPLALCHVVMRRLDQWLQAAGNNGPVC